MWYIVTTKKSGRMEYFGPLDTREEAETEAFNLVLRNPELSGSLEVVQGNSTYPYEPRHSGEVR